MLLQLVCRPNRRMFYDDDDDGDDDDDISTADQANNAQNSL